MIKCIKQKLSLFIVLILLSWDNNGVCSNDPLDDEYYLTDPKETVEGRLKETVEVLTELKKIAKDGLGTANNMSSDLRDIKEKNHDLEIKVIQAASERSLLQREQFLIKERQTIIKEKTDWVLRKVETQETINLAVTENLQICLETVKNIKGWGNILIGILCPVIAGIILMFIKKYRNKRNRIDHSLK